MVAKKTKNLESLAARVFKPQDFQKSFVKSTSCYPCRVAPWGDGKTVCAIMMGMNLSMMYPGNEGLIIRKRYNALQRSTMSDFYEWTRLRVPSQHHMVTVPGCESTIHFSQAENMIEFKEGLQGMNLGWAYIEQGDDFDSAEVFDMLTGRVRRILTPNKEIQDKLIDLGVMKKHISDFRILTERKREMIEKAIVERLKLAVRQIIVIANTAGHNWIYKRWKKNPLEGYELFEGKPFENRRYLPKSTQRQWNQMRITSPKKFNRYILNSWEDYDIEGSYYAELMSDALKDKRVEMDSLYDVSYPVCTFWDLGVSDETAIWFAQFINEEIRLIDYYSNTGKGMNFYSKMLSDKPYEYTDHFLPHDAGQRLQGENVTTRLDIMRRLREHKGENVHVVIRHSVAERIETVRSILNKCKFDDRCEKGVESMNRYHREVNKAKSSDETTVFIDHPAKDQWTHGADAFGYMAIVLRYMRTCISEFVGEVSEWYDYGTDRGVTNLLEVRR